ncbi:MAG: PhoH family protein [Alphaproteobacteria bacterium]|nr:PhoH family protein [Alphaproteobacteria bacterium]
MAPIPGVDNENPSSSASLSFENHRLLPMLYGEHDAHLSRIEQQLGVNVASRGNHMVVSADNAKNVAAGRAVLESLYAQLQDGREVGMAQVDAAIRMAQHAQTGAVDQDALPGMEELVIKTMKKHVRPYSPGQAAYIHALQMHDVVFALGPAGTGKTYLAVAMAVSMFMHRRVERIILSRPAVEAGERLGFLPGDLKEKIDPYLRPLYDALFDMIPPEKVQHFLETGAIEVAPLAFMRGRTLSNAFVILDESQNTTATQMKMFLTRLGEHSRMVVTGDLTQVDLPRDVKSGLSDAIRKLEGIEGIATTRFSDADIVRHPLAARIVQAYDEWDRKKKNNS